MVDHSLDLSPLHDACQLGQINIIEALLEDGADLNSKDSKGCTPLHLTLCGGGCEEAALKLLESGECCVNIQDDNGHSPLHWAAHRGNLNILKLLIKYGADITLKDSRDQTPLDLAVAEDEYEIVEVLLDRGAFYPRALLNAIRNSEYGNSHMIKMLLPFVFDVDKIRTEKGETALHLSVGTLNSDVPQVLLEAGANVDAVSISSKDTPLHLALEFYWREDLQDLLNTLLNWLPDVNLKNVDGRTPLEMSMTLLLDNENDLLKHICKLYAAGMLKTWKLGMSVESLLFPLLSDFHKGCTSEVIKLKNTIRQDITLYSLLTKSLNKLVGLLRNKSVQSDLTDEFINLLQFKYPMYGVWLKNKLKFALTRSLLIESNRHFFILLNLPNFPHHCSDLIFSHLTNQELFALSSVYE